MTDQELLSGIVTLIDSKKAEDIVVYNISKVSSLADYIIIATATSEIHVNSLSDYVKEEMKKQGEAPLGIDGYKVSKWVCVDFGNILLHLMCQSEREHYNLEAVWGGSKKLDLQSLIKQGEA